ncbi:pilin [Photobacterium sp. GB-72]|uniref:pilin n=1 Tax=Photobacterium sp. GB-72 TaxID=2022105 RepID=UPI000D16F6DE|nr:pilin [Photobacterium sp. GB-72]PSV31727.1 prepilin-type cleavage/methylation domain-containing protein [Photobacterium sp. GB-72]
MKKQQGFTLIELMIVVAVIGVLAAIAVPQYQNYIKKSELGAGLATIAGLKVNLEDKIATDANFPAYSVAEAKTNIGAPSTAIGTIYTLADASASSAGSIVIKFTGGQNSGKKLAVVRDGAGNWTCKTDATSSSTYPKGCTNASIANP